jgi:hypothetical protein
VEDGRGGAPRADRESYPPEAARDILRGPDPTRLMPVPVSHDLEVPRRCAETSALRARVP